MTTYTEIFFDAQDSNNEGWAYRKYTRDNHGCRDDIDSGSIESLDDLLDALSGCKIEDDRIMANLPTFGGVAPADTEEVWSWDESRLLVGSGMNDMRIVSRDKTATVREGSQYIGRFSAETAPNEFLRQLVAEALENGEATAHDDDGAEVTAVADEH